jgi:hypothetical protein
MVHMPWTNTAGRADFLTAQDLGKPLADFEAQFSTPVMSQGASAFLSSNAPLYSYDHWQSPLEAQWPQPAQVDQSSISAQDPATVKNSYAAPQPSTTQRLRVAQQPEVVTQLGTP